MPEHISADPEAGSTTVNPQFVAPGITTPPTDFDTSSTDETIPDLPPLADDDVVDPRIRIIAGAAIPESRDKKRVNALRTLYDAGVIDLDPEHLAWTRYILNWDAVHSALPRKVRGQYHYTGTPLRMSDGVLVHYVEAIMPTRFLMAQLANYRIPAARSLRDEASKDAPVSRAYGRQRDGRELAVLVHRYFRAENLRRVLNDANEDLIKERRRLKGWDTLLDSIKADGVTDGGLWVQTVFEAVDEAGHEIGYATASLTPADAHSRKAAADYVQDPDGLFAAAPVEEMLRRDVFGPMCENPDEPAGRAETIMEPVYALKKALNELAEDPDTRPYRLDDLDDDLRAQVNTAVMRVRVVIAVEDDGQNGALTGPDLFRAAQGHFHSNTHLGHTPVATQRLVADKVRSALLAFDPIFETDPGYVEWTPDLLSAFSLERDYEGLPNIGLPADRIGAAIAAYMLVTSDGPERAVVGQALGSQPRGGEYDNLLKVLRHGLLRELVFPDRHDVNLRTFEPIDWAAVFAAPQTTFDGDIDALFDRYASGVTTEWEEGLVDVIAAVRAVELGIHTVDLGSKGQARGWLRTKIGNAVHGRTVEDRETGDPILVKPSEAGKKYTRALLTGTLLTSATRPRPQTVNGVALSHPTTAQWEAWAASGTATLDEDGETVLRKELAIEVDEHGDVVLAPDGGPAKTLIEAPEPVTLEVFDAFSVAAMRKKAAAVRAAGSHSGNSKTPAAEFAAAMTETDNAWQVLEDQITTLRSLVVDGYIAPASDRARLSRIVRLIRVSATPGGDPGEARIADQVEDIVHRSEEAERDEMDAEAAAVHAGDVPAGWDPNDVLLPDPDADEDDSDDEAWDDEIWGDPDGAGQ